MCSTDKILAHWNHQWHTWFWCSYVHLCDKHARKGSLVRMEKSLHKHIPSRNAPIYLPKKTKEYALFCLWACGPVCSLVARSQLCEQEQIEFSFSLCKPQVLLDLKPRLMAIKDSAEAAIAFLRLRDLGPNLDPVLENARPNISCCINRKRWTNGVKLLDTQNETFLLHQCIVKSYRDLCVRQFALHRNNMVCVYLTTYSKIVLELLKWVKKPTNESYLLPVTAIFVLPMSPGRNLSARWLTLGFVWLSNKWQSLCLNKSLEYKSWE